VKAKNTKYKFIFAGGGTGGHIFPAIAVAEHVRKLIPEAEILFIGTKNKIESRVVPKYGFKFKSIWISGFARKLSLKNLIFPIKLFFAAIQSLILNIKFKPKVVIGTGAYVAGPVIWAASILGSKIILLEQNSYPGITNRLLEKKANEIHIAFEDSKKYFREKSKLHLTGNPLRINLELMERTIAREKLGLDKNKKTLLILGGSLGARSINEAVKFNIEKLLEAEIQIIWQTGQLYFEEFIALSEENLIIVSFIEDVSTALSAADLVVARAGATSIAELSYLGIPVIFVPSPNVAANHQYKNAKSLVDENAALLIEDDKIKQQLSSEVERVINDDSLLKNISQNIKKFAKPDSALKIAERVIKLADAA
jgi:UDP-N-acetylglucosamine--N-acetylmuramyl-(pentapeptide) pyrophosphoryl-undecaprenol N-acetylglucosamine transferase